MKRANYRCTHCGASIKNIPYEGDSYYGFCLSAQDFVLCLRTKDTFLFGDEVLLRRGGHDKPAYGGFRQVKATYLGASGNQVLCRLEQDDPNGGSPNLKGEKGWWSRSVMSKAWGSEK